MLTTPAPSGSPGSAAWTNAAALPGAVKFSQVLIANSTPIFGSDTNPQPFDVTITIPAGLLESGDIFLFSYAVTVSVDAAAPPPGDSFAYGINISGQTSTVPAVTQSPGFTGGLLYGGNFGGVQNAGVAAAILTFGTTSVPDYLVGDVRVDGFTVFNVDTTVPVVVGAQWEWQAGAQALSEATLAAIQVIIIKSAP
jgi:hypothetical protein